MSFDPIDFQPNSVGVLVVRVIRLKDIMRTLGCSEPDALAVVREIRGETSADKARVFVLPSQLAAWTYQQAGRAVPPSRPMVVKETASTEDALRSAVGKDERERASSAMSKAGKKKLILSKREAAKLLGVGRNQTLHDLIARGLLRTVVVNGQVKVPRADVERIAREGFDLDVPRSPMPRAALKPAKGREGGVETAIRKLKL
jgi:excisionase family DNA binding protein